jgi:hypothetical protein
VAVRYRLTLKDGSPRLARLARGGAVVQCGVFRVPPCFDAVLRFAPSELADGRRLLARGARRDFRHRGAANARRSFGGSGALGASRGDRARRHLGPDTPHRWDERLGALGRGWGARGRACLRSGANGVAGALLGDRPRHSQSNHDRCRNPTDSGGLRHVACPPVERRANVISARLRRSRLRAKRGKDHGD